MRRCDCCGQKLPAKNKFKAFWGIARIVLSVIWATAAACTCFLAAVASSMVGPHIIAYYFAIVFAPPLIIQTLERRARWVDERWRWIKD